MKLHCKTGVNMPFDALVSFSLMWFQIDMTLLCCNLVWIEAKVFVRSELNLWGYFNIANCGALTL